MKRSDTITLGEFRKQTEGMEDDVAILVTAEGPTKDALPVSFYPFDTTLDHQGVLLLRPDTTASIQFEDC